MLGPGAWTAIRGCPMIRPSPAPAGTDADTERDVPALPAAADRGRRRTAADGADRADRARSGGGVRLAVRRPGLRTHPLPDRRTGAAGAAPVPRRAAGAGWRLLLRIALVPAAGRRRHGL